VRYLTIAFWTVVALAVAFMIFIIVAAAIGISEGA
jgi:hypothetical protein